MEWGRGALGAEGRGLLEMGKGILERGEGNLRKWEEGVGGDLPVDADKAGLVLLVHTPIVVM